MGFKELLKDSVTEVFTYRTTKLVKTNDKFLVTLHFIFMSLIATFALVSILLSHNYMVFELPALYVTTTYRNFGPDPVTINVAVAKEIAQNSTVDYCNTGYVNWRRAGKVFNDAYMTALECSAQHAPSEFVWPFDSGNGITIGTFEEVHSVTRACTTPGAPTYAAAGCTETATPPQAYMVVGADLLSMQLDIRYQTASGSLLEAEVVDVNGQEYITSITKPTVTFPQLLAMAGINSLDEANPSIVGDQGSVTGLPYRMSGLRLNVKVSFTNTYFSKPLKTTVMATLSAEQVKTNNFNAKTTVTYLPHPTVDGIHSITRYFHTWATTTVTFVASGRIGKFDLFALALAITNAFVLIGMATTIVDFVGVMSSETFLDDKYEDDGERFGLEMMLANIENDDHPGVPFDPNDLRLKDAAGDPGLSYEKTLEQLLDEVREIQEQLSLLPEDENELRAITTGHAEEEEYRKLRLIYVPDPLSTEANDKSYVPPEILLHDGQQTIGRGMGGIENKGVSRQQFSIAVIKERIRMKSLHEGPGVWRQSTGRWEMLPVGKAAVLSVGDRLCFRMREGKLGGHEGVFTLDYQDTRMECTVFGIPLR
jgi:hypothetical protein